MTFEDLLREHDMEEQSIKILKSNGIIDTEVLLALDKDDLKELGLNVGQRALLWRLVGKLKTLEGEESTTQGSSQRNQNYEWEQDKKGKSFRSKQECAEKNYRRKTTAMTVHEKLENMNEDSFWCILKCFGGIGAVGLGGILALITLVTYGLPAIGFGAAGIAAGTLAAKIMALYGGKVAAGSLMAILQSVAAAGIGWNAILTAFFGSSAVVAAVTGGCAHCLDES